MKRIADPRRRRNRQVDPRLVGERVVESGEQCAQPVEREQARVIRAGRLGGLDVQRLIHPRTQHRHLRPCLA
jgi:hypothetical protein